MKSDDPHAMQGFYRRDEERRRWGEDMAGRGLYPTESDLIAKYFPTAGSILNIGCGGGREAFALASLGYAVIAVDLDEDFVIQAKRGAAERGLAVDCRVMDALGLRFDDGAFDMVVMVGQLVGHIRGRNKRIAALREAYRVARPGGVGLFSTNSIEAHWKYRLWFAFADAARLVYNPAGLEPGDARVFRHKGRRQFFGGGNRPIFHWYRTDEFRRDLAEAGWRPSEWARRSAHEQLTANHEGLHETFHIAVKETP